MVLILLTSYTYSGIWLQTDWSGGEGQLYWADSTMYWSGSKINGKLNRGVLSLEAPNIDSLVKITELPNVEAVNCLSQTLSGEIYAGTGWNSGDIFRSVDNGLTWDTTTINYSYITTVYCIAEGRNGILYAGTNRVILISDDNGLTWELFVDMWPSEAILSLIQCSVDPNLLFAGLGYSSGYMAKSTDAGKSWSRTYSTDSRVICLLESSDNTIYAGTGNNWGRVWKTTNYGTTWEQTTKPPGAKTINCLAEGWDGSIMVGTDTSATVYKSSDAGSTWVSTGDIEQGLAVYDIVLGDEDAIYAGVQCNDYTGHVFSSQNAGTTWVDQGALPDVAYVLSLLRLKDGTLLVGTQTIGGVPAAIYKAGYFQDGELVSSVYDTKTTNGSTKYGTINWEEELNGQLLGIKVRSCNDSTMLGAPDWSVCPSAINGDTLSTLSSVNDGERYIQYRVEFSTSDYNFSTVLHSISIEYDVDTTGPFIDTVFACDGEFQQNGLDIDDYIVVVFDEPTNMFTVGLTNIDSILKLSGSDGWGSIDSTLWSGEGDTLSVYLDILSTVSVGDTIYPNGDSITDIFGNPSYSYCVITGTFDDINPPVMSAYAFDAADSVEGIDDDDEVIIVFNERVDTTVIIDSTNIDEIFDLSNGHSWGKINSTQWISEDTLIVYLSEVGATIALGDTIYPDGLTVKDLADNPCDSPAVIGGTFGDYGPLMVEATAFDDPWNLAGGIDNWDYVIVTFSEVTNCTVIDSSNIDNVLPLSNSHTWLPIIKTEWNETGDQLKIVLAEGGVDRVNSGDVVYTDSLTIQDVDGHPCVDSCIIGGSFNPTGVDFTIHHLPVTSYQLSQNYPNPFNTTTEIRCRISENRKMENGNFSVSQFPISLSIYDASGRLVRTFRVYQCQHPRSSVYSVVWDGKDSVGRKVPSGVYFYQLVIGDFKETKKLLLIR